MTAPKIIVKLPKKPVETMVKLTKYNPNNTISYDLDFPLSLLKLTELGQVLIYENTIEPITILDPFTKEEFIKSIEWIKNQYKPFIELLNKIIIFDLMAISEENQKFLLELKPLTTDFLEVIEWLRPKYLELYRIWIEKDYNKLFKLKNQYSLVVLSYHPNKLWSKSIINTKTLEEFKMNIYKKYINSDRHHNLIGNLKIPLYTIKSKGYLFFYILPNPDGSGILCWEYPKNSYQRMIRYYDIKTRKPISCLFEANDPIIYHFMPSIRIIRFSHCGKYVAFGIHFNLYVKSLETGETVKRIEVNGQIENLDYSFNDKFVVVSYNDFDASLYKYAIIDIENSNIIGSYFLENPESGIINLRMHPTKDLFALLTTDGKIYVYNINEELVNIINCKNNFNPFVCNEDFLITLSYYKIKVWSWEGNNIHTIDFNTGNIKYLQWNDNKLLLISDRMKIKDWVCYPVGEVASIWNTSKENPKEWEKIKEIDIDNHGVLLGTNQMCSLTKSQNVIEVWNI